MPDFQCSGIVPEHRIIRPNRTPEYLARPDYPPQLGAGLSGLGWFRGFSERPRGGWFQTATFLPTPLSLSTIAAGASPPRQSFPVRPLSKFLAGSGSPPS